VYDCETGGTMETVDTATSEPGALQEVYAAMDAGQEAFVRGDIEGWLGVTHPSAHTFQVDHFTTFVDLAAGPIESQMELNDGWTTVWREGLVDGDTACVWGEVEWFYRLEDERHGVRMAGSWHWVKTDGVWKTLFAHYSLLNSPQV
jgi:hypothetical protein